MPMKIVQIHTHYRDAGGEDSVVAAEAGLLRNAGHDVVQVSFDNEQSAARTAISLALAPHNPIQASRIRRIVATTTPDVAHVHNTWYAASPAVVSAVASLDVPVVATLHNFRVGCANGLLQRDGEPCELCLGASPWPGVRYRCFRGSATGSAASALTISYNRARGTWHDNVRRFLVLSEFAKERLIRAGLPEDRLVVTPNFTGDRGPRSSPPSQSSDVLFAGRLVEGKGIRTLLAAWEQAAPRGLRLLVAGDGEALDEVKARDDRSVVSLGWIDGEELAARMRSARALLFPSEYYENMPMTILEAFASGLPVLASDRGSMPEIVAPLGLEWLAAPADPSAWAERLDAIGDDGMVDAAGRAARQAYEDRYTPQRAIARLEAAYRA
jgi:glycosyltransferase involved in cell wall biosynthesis